MTGDTTIAAVDRDLGIHEKSLYEWTSKAKEQARGGVSFEEHEELVRLRPEVKRLRMERDILKKAAALMGRPRLSRTLFEYPVVADVDNDKSAEIVVVSNECIPPCNDDPSPAVQVIRDAEDRWLATRRIWNQGSYHVTNVREDGTIPMVEAPSWTQLNTFRTNASVEEDGPCIPEPVG